MACALRQRGYRVTPDGLLDPLTDGAFVARVVVRIAVFSLALLAVAGACFWTRRLLALAAEEGRA